MDRGSTAGQPTLIAETFRTKGLWSDNLIGLVLLLGPEVGVALLELRWELKRWGIGSRTMVEVRE